MLADASKNKIFKVQQAGSEANKCWQSLKNNEEYKGSGHKISAIERSPEKSEPVTSFHDCNLLEKSITLQPIPKFQNDSRQAQDGKNGRSTTPRERY